MKVLMLKTAACESFVLAVGRYYNLPQAVIDRIGPDAYKQVADVPKGKKLFTIGARPDPEAPASREEIPTIDEDEDDDE